MLFGCICVRKEDWISVFTRVRWFKYLLKYAVVHFELYLVQCCGLNACYLWKSFRYISRG